jgi:hypothetical protein
MDLCLRLPFRTEFHLSEYDSSLAQPELQVEG